jgi:integrase/recombinase XerD
MPTSNLLLLSHFIDYARYECGTTDDKIAAHEKSLAHLAAWLDPMWLPDATRIMLQLYIGEALSQGTSAHTVVRRLSHFRHFYQFLINENKIEIDPTKGLSMPKYWTKTKAKEGQHSASIVTWIRMDFEALH